MWEIALPILAVSVSIVGLVFEHFTTIADIRKEHYRATSEIRERVARLETKVDTLWLSVTPKLVGLLKSPSNLLKDRLLDKLAEQTLTSLEAKQLKALLERELPNKGKASTYLACALTIASLDWIIKEAELSKTETKGG